MIANIVVIWFVLEIILSSTKTYFY